MPSAALLEADGPNLTTMEVGALGSMTRLAATLFAWALALGCAQANAQAGATPPTPEHSEGPQSAEPDASQTSLAHPPTADDICRALEHAAAENALPVEFFARVIWQESRFNASAVSPKGAEGIAQFMPRTADWHGLADPFNPIEALRHSAGYLRELRDRFGNLGLAAAAYNAGPQQVQDWLVARSSLPKETRRYVEIVTGHSAAEWSGGTTQPDLALPESVPCLELARSIEPRTAAKSDIGHHDGSTGSGPASKPGWGVQLVGSSSQAAALASFQQLQKAHKGVLETRQPLILQSKVGTSGFWYRVRVATDGRSEAEKLCAALRAAGGGCLVQRY